MSIVNVGNASALMQALKVAQAGDTIALQSGTYAGVNLSNIKFAQDVTITSADPGKPAVLTSLAVSGSEGLTFRDLEFKVDPAGGAYAFRVSDSKDIHFDRLDVRGTMNGTPADDATAFLIRDSSDVSIMNSEFQQLLTGISTLNNNGIKFSNNYFHDIRSDGIQGGGNSNVVIINNRFSDFFPDEGDHPDAIQFWTVNTSASGQNYVISGNIISRGAGAPIQGIFLSDESGGKFPYLNVKITDNLLIGAAWNGITLNGKGGEIGGNTLISYADQASRIRVEFSNGLNIHDNSAGGYVYLSNVNTNTSGNGTTGAVGDGGASALAKWLSAHPDFVVGIEPPELPPMIEKPTPPTTPPSEGGEVSALPPVSSNINGLKLVAGTGGGTLEGSARNSQPQGAAGADRLEGGVGNDQLSGAGGNDTLFGREGDDVLHGEAGDDYLDGGAGDDTLLGGAGNDVIHSGAGNDVVEGGAGNDTITNSGGSDSIDGGEGDDNITGGADADTIFGGDGNDTITTGDGANVVNGNKGNDSIVGGKDADILSGGQGADTITCGDGDDWVNGNIGADLVSGGNGDDTLLGGQDNDTITGDAGNDLIFGDLGDDSLDGGAGDDLLHGGGGADTMTGGSGKDTFIFKAGDFAGGVNASMDVIRDFSAADGDNIHLGDVDANVLTGVNDAFKFIGTSQFHRVAGELRYEVAEGSAYVMGDVNGDGVADFKIQLIGVDSLKAGDFFL